jgi:hypothetical protein
VGADGATLVFQLVVNDGAADSNPQDVTVTVEHVNHPPIADAGLDQTVNEGSQVTLNGTGSTDPDGDPLSYHWQQTGVASLTLENANTATPTFTAPAVGPGGATLVFQLTVSDNMGGSASDAVIITVQDVNDPPAGNLARAKPERLWPPNHKLVPVEIVGLSDPDSDNVTITITGVTQDEPVNGLGDGDTTPDAVIQGNKVLLRAERAAGGNGRVYQVAFTADDGKGGTCNGTVTVGVPKDRKDSSCVDDGQLYDSTQP